MRWCFINNNRRLHRYQFVLLNLRIGQIRVKPLAVQQIFVSALLDDPSSIEHEDPIGISDRA
jgi:hypothetical protein